MSQLERAERTLDEGSSLPRASIKKCYSERWKDWHFKNFRRERVRNTE